MLLNVDRPLVAVAIKVPALRFPESAAGRETEQEKRAYCRQAKGEQRVIKAKHWGRLCMRQKG
jgi:hypothetical protein